MPGVAYRAIEGSEKLPTLGARKIGVPDPREVIEVNVLLRPIPTPERSLTAKQEQFVAKPPKERTCLSRQEYESPHGAVSPSSSLSHRFYRFSGVRGPEIVESVGAPDEKANVVQTYPLEAGRKP
jgi:hypothetical protein